MGRLVKGLVIGCGRRTFCLNEIKETNGKFGIFKISEMFGIIRIEKRAGKARFSILYVVLMICACVHVTLTVYLRTTQSLRIFLYPFPYCRHLETLDSVADDISVASMTFA